MDNYNLFLCLKFVAGIICVGLLLAWIYYFSTLDNKEAGAGGY